MTLRPVSDELLTRQEFAGRMRVSVATVDRRIRAGMPVVRFSPGTVRIEPRAAMMWAEQQLATDRKAA